MRLADRRSNRVDPTMLDTCHPDHRARYEFAASQVSGKVLDAGCGFGYGTEMLAANASMVVGIDLYDDAIDFARRHYQRVGYPSIRFERADVVGYEAAEAPFDTVVCMEAVEHVEDDVGFVAALRGLLRPGGSLVISTPNKLVTSPHGEPSDPTHVREYAPEDFRALLVGAGFEHVELHGLHLGASVFARHRTRSRLGRLDRLGVRRLLPARFKARIVSHASPKQDAVRIDRHVATAHDQIAVAW